MWSRTHPAILFGAAVTGWAGVPGRVRVARTPFPHCTSCPNEISAAGASGDLAHTVALEYTTASVNGAPPQPLASEAADPRPTPAIMQIFSRKPPDGTRPRLPHIRGRPQLGGPGQPALNPGRSTCRNR